MSTSPAYKILSDGSSEAFGIISFTGGSSGETTTAAAITGATAYTAVTPPNPSIKSSAVIYFGSSLTSSKGECSIRVSLSASSSSTSFSTTAVSTFT